MKNPNPSRIKAAKTSTKAQTASEKFQWSVLKQLAPLVDKASMLPPDEKQFFAEELFGFGRVLMGDCAPEGKRDVALKLLDWSNEMDRKAVDECLDNRELSKGNMIFGNVWIKVGITRDQASKLKDAAKYLMNPSHRTSGKAAWYLLNAALANLEIMSRLCEVPRGVPEKFWDEKTRALKKCLN